MPPRFSLCLTVLPLDASIGLAPQSMAKAASEPILPGLSPAAIPSVAALIAPHPLTSSSAGASLLTSPSMADSSSAALSAASIHVLAMLRNADMSPSVTKSPVGFLFLDRAAIMLALPSFEYFSLIGSGAVSIRDFTRFDTLVCVPTSMLRAQRSGRAASDQPSRDLGMETPLLAAASLAALSAST